MKNRFVTDEALWPVKIHT